MPLTGRYFDGKTSAARPVEVDVLGQTLTLLGASVRTGAALAQVTLGDLQDDGSVALYLPDGAHCVVSDGAALRALFKANGHGGNLLQRIGQRIERQLAWSLGAVLLLAGIVFSAYQWGLPVLSEHLAPRVPERISRQLGDYVLTGMEQDLLRPSRLSEARQAAIRQGVTELMASDPALRNVQLHFRSSPRIGPNAFALPGGNLVLLDEMANTVSDDEAVAVIAHELGHHALHHPLRNLIQSAVVSAVTFIYFGDFSSAIASTTALALSAAYSREFELDADRYAAQRLTAVQRDVNSLLRVLARHGADHTAGVLDSHPDLAARRAAIEAWTRTQAQTAKP